MRRSVLLFLATAPSLAAAQGRDDGGESGPRTLLPRAEEVALARSAAPAAISDSATIYVLTDEGYVVGSKGTSAAACYVSRDWITSVEPHCFDAEGAATIMQMHMHKVGLLHAGKSKAQADAAVAEGIASGRFRLPRRPVMSYMMSAEQKLIAPNGTPVGAWRPHLMIYYPYLTNADIGLTDAAAMGAASVVDPGLPTSNIMVIVPDFVAVRR
jgi:hypothetical protein